MPSRFTAAIYEVCAWATFLILLIGFSFRAAGRFNVPRRGPVLLIANHQSFIDPPAIGVAAPRHLYFLARKTLFKNVVMDLGLRALNSVPIDQEGVGKEGMRNILARLEAGQAV